MATVQTEVRDLVAHVRSLGWIVRLGADNHYYVERPDGKPAMVDGRPFSMGATPSDVRWRANAVAAMKRGGIIQEDPRKLEQMSLAKRDPELKRQRDEARRQLARAGNITLEPISSRQAHVAQLVRLALEHIDNHQELGDLALRTAKAKGIKAPESASINNANLERLLEGRVVGNYVLRMYEEVLKDLGAWKPYATPKAETKEPTVPQETTQARTVKVSDYIEKYGETARVSKDSVAAQIDGGWRCECGHVAPDLRGIAAHLRSYITAACPECGVRMGVSGLGPHRRFCTQTKEEEKVARPRKVDSVPAPEPEPVVEAAIPVAPTGLSPEDQLEVVKHIAFAHGVLDQVGSVAAKRAHEGLTKVLAKVLATVVQ